MGRAASCPARTGQDKLHTIDGQIEQARPDSRLVGCASVCVRGHYCAVSISLINIITRTWFRCKREGETPPTPSSVIDIINNFPILIPPLGKAPSKRNVILTKTKNDLAIYVMLYNTTRSLCCSLAYQQPLPVIRNCILNTFKFFTIFLCARSYVFV